LKEALIIPIQKKGDRNLCDNYRPISILPNLSKIFEHIIYEQTLQFFELHSLLHNNQNSFRKNLCTLSALTSFLNNVYNAFNSGTENLTIFIDLSKAFDLMDHNTSLIN